MAKYPMRNCKNCGTPFQTKKRNNVFCSRKCAIRYFDKMRRKPPLPERECPICHKLFTPKSKIAVFCSKQCCAKRYTLIERKTERRKHKIKQPKQPQPKPEFTINEYFCFKCKKKVHARISGKGGFCPVCGNLVFGFATTESLPNYAKHIEKSTSKKQKKHVVNRGTWG